MSAESVGAESGAFFDAPGDVSDTFETTDGVSGFGETVLGESSTTVLDICESTAFLCCFGCSAFSAVDCESPHPEIRTNANARHEILDTLKQYITVPLLDSRFWTTHGQRRCERTSSIRTNEFSRKKRNEKLSKKVKIHENVRNFN